MNKAKIMKRAWEIRREHKDNIFGLCLKMAWAEAKEGKMEKKTVEELENLGFKRWTKAGKDRMYVKAYALGLKVVWRNTGSIKESYWQGSEVSHGMAGRLLSCKTYIDLLDGKVYGDDKDLVAEASRISGYPVA